MSVGSLNLTKLRLNGLSSGLDTDSIVTSLLKVDQYKVDKQFKAKTKLEWKGDALREVNNALKTFRQQNMSVLNSANNMLSASTYRIYKVRMESASSAVDISAGNNAAAASMSIDKITQLATNAQLKGSAISTDPLSMDSKLSELSLSNDLGFNEAGNISFTINDVDFTFTKDNTLSDVITKINSSDAGVTMRYSSLTKGFYITSNSTGSQSTVHIENGIGKAFAQENSAFGIAEQTKTGQDAILTIDGVEVRKQNNSFTIDGITYTLRSKSDTPVSFSVERDIDSVYKKISDFVDSYNALITSLQGKLDEDTYSDYEPLTDQEEEALSESQIEKWESKAKSGLLKNDGNIRSMLNTMRNAFYATVEGAGISASEIGLTTEPFATTGKIQIDEQKLREAISDDPDQMIKLFTNTSTATSGPEVFNQSGLITRISNAISSYTDTATNITLDSLNDDIDRAGEKLTSWSLHLRR